MSTTAVSWDWRVGVVSLDPAVQFFSKIWIIGHQFVHVHDIRFYLGVALYLVRHWSRFGKHKAGSSVGVAQFASLLGICSSDPFTTVESNYSNWLSITMALAFDRGF